MAKDKRDNYARALAMKIKNTTIGDLEDRLSNLESSYSASLQRIDELETKLADYETHTHNYNDTTISDTADGSGIESVATKTTSTKV